MSALYRLMEKIKDQYREKSEAVFQVDKERFVNLLISYLQDRLQSQYYYTDIQDINGNHADALLLANSQLLLTQMKGKDLLEFDVAQLIDNRFVHNEDEIIILDVNGKAKEINMQYLIETLETKNISYSRKYQKGIAFFLEYLIKKRIRCKEIG